MTVHVRIKAMLAHSFDHVVPIQSALSLSSSSSSSALVVIDRPMYARLHAHEYDKML